MYALTPEGADRRSTGRRAEALVRVIVVVLGYLGLLTYML